MHLMPPVARRRAVALIACLALPSLAGCLPLDGKAERTFSATEPKPTALVLDSRFLDVDLQAVKGDSVGIEATIILQTSGGNETAEREIEKCLVRVERDGTTLRVVQGPEGESGKKIEASSWSGRGTLKLTLPEGVPFRIASASGDVNLHGDFGAVAGVVRIASGDLKGTLSVDSFEQHSASGDAKLSFEHGLTSLLCKSASGDVSVAAPSIADATFEAASGNIDVRGLAGPAKATAASGDISLLFQTFGSNAHATIKAASGDISVRLPAGSKPSGSIKTASGEIRTDVPAQKGKRSTELTGDGAKLEISAASGDVTVTTAPAT